MRCVGRKTGSRTAVALVLGALAWIGAAAAQADGITVERGDVLAVSLLGEAWLDREAKVDASGSIVLPQVGSIAVAGSSLEEIRATIEASLRHRQIHLSPTVVVGVARYRPLYVGGDVTRPGALAYEPGLTVRHALVLSGGIARGEGEFGISDAAELNVAARTTAFSLLEVQSRIARLQAELRRTPAEISVPASIADGDQAEAIIALDETMLLDRLGGYEADQEHRRELVNLVEFELDVLDEQTKAQKEEGELQRAELENTRMLAEQNLVPLSRLQALEREQLRASRALLEVQAFTARARQSKQTLAHEIEDADRQWLLEVRNQLRAALIEEEGLEREMDRLAAEYLAAGISVAAAGRQPAEPEIIVYRRVGASERTVSATMRTELLPGDIVEVEMRLPASPPA